MPAKKRALISVSDKRYVTVLARDLVKYGYEIVASGGTAKKLKEAKIPVKDVSRLYRTQELVGGRVKTLSPLLSAAILADRDKKEHAKDLSKAKVVPIDLVVAIPYQFHKKVKAGKTSITDAMELIDIGGLTLLRAAAKNNRHVAVICRLEQYKELTDHLKEHEEITPEFRLELAREAFSFSARYEAKIASYLEHVAPVDIKSQTSTVAEAPTEVLPKQLSLSLNRAEVLRYGENPHQRSARYNIKGLPTLSYKVLQGKEMSYNNFLDASAALSVVSANYPSEYAACVVKHLNPCGIAVGDDPVKTFINARDADPKSAFGGIVGLNYPVSEGLAAQIKKTFFEIVIAPSFDSAARSQLSSKKNLRLIEASPAEMSKLQHRSPKVVITTFGAMLQEHDYIEEQWEKLEFVSDPKPDEALREDILLGLTFIRFLKSNSLCLVKNGIMVGAGLGQMSRVDAAEIAIKAAGRRAKGAILVSDGFFP
ncbi:MAG TPA: bifunctional phosphoribosylaminoimidazolecarboxamide formyltransferase/IMP cyclohydrolase, partial [Firmicutes bacterium]|nr:bifunctional phosphoribosylaminoimidazolecarboxamide formyltransferase/IMP cyclohydrolase [Bacillota bacterium]